ncbi:hypothetical protein NQ314_009820 [Rhamnusium bicolor]|uniref:Uncharacterized protein n=1 Tax=Rhamnusium bicolor TaxID=1586634 RepID=A0AAV8XXK8_9CUCU|nr:hypothetical protein NQ314_009820 [Rhamnusium bicolor]
MFKAKANITSKFVPRRDGPYQISRIVSPTSYKVKDLANQSVSLGTYHVSALTKYVPSINEGTLPVPLHPIRPRGCPRHQPQRDSVNLLQPPTPMMSVPVSHSSK